MSAITIYNKTGVKRYDAPITMGAQHVHELMKENYIQLTFNAPLIDFALGDYVIYEGQTYSLFTLPQPKRNSSFWNYTIQFESFEANFRNATMFYIPETGAKESEWSLTSTPAAFVAMAIKNINRFLGTSIEIGTVISGEVKSLSFNNTNVWDALTQIAESYETEWWWDGTSLNLSKCEYGSGEELEVDKHITKAEGSDGNMKGYATRIYPFGSTRNIIPDVVSEATTSILNNRLHLKDLEYIDARDNLSKEDIVEAVVIFENIYPRFIDHSITSIRSEKENIEDTEQDVYYFKDSTLTEDISALLIEGLTLSVKFESGNLNGREFELAWHPASREFEIINQNESGSIIIPNSALCPAVGDKIVLFNLKMPDELKEEAQAELLLEAQAYITESSKDRTVYTCPANSPYCHKNEIDYNVGQKVTLKGREFGDGRESRIQRIEKSLYNKYVATYQVGDNAKYSRLNNLETEARQANYAYSSILVGGSAMKLITRYDTTAPSDFNTYSGLRIDKDFLKKKDAEEVFLSKTAAKDEYISKTKDDTVEGNITFNNGIIVKSRTSTRLMSRAISESGIPSVVSIDSNIVESGIPSTNSLDTNIQEKQVDGGTGASTIGELMNVSANTDNIENVDVILLKLQGTDNWIPMSLDELGIGQGVQYDMQLINNLDNRNFSSQIGQECWIDFIFQSREKVSISSPFENTGERGALEIFVKRPTDETFILVNTRMIQSGTSVKIEVSEYLGTGANQVMLRCTGEITEKITPNLVYNIQLTSLGIHANTFTWWTGFKGSSINVPYFISGNVIKVLHVEVSGTDYNQNYNVNVGLGSYADTPYTYSIPAPPLDGVYKISAYVSNSDGSIKTKKIEFNIVYGHSTKSICINNRNPEPKNWYENAMFDYSISDKEATYTEAKFTVKKEDGSVLFESIENSILTGTKQTFVLPIELETIDEENFNLTAEITDESGFISETLGFEIINSEGFGAQAGVVFQMSPKYRTNSQNDAMIMYNDVTGDNINCVWSGVNWANDGWITSTYNGAKCLRLNTGAKVIIDYKPFERECARTGKVIEFSYRLFNITDYSKVAIKIGDRLQIQPDLIYIGSSNLNNEENQSIPTDNDERIHVAINILPDAYGVSGFNIASIYINGVRQRAFLYQSNDYWADNNKIEIGSENADIDLFGIRMYNTGLGSTSIFKNYINWLGDNDVKTTLVQKNDVFNAEGTALDFEKLKQSHNIFVFDVPFPNFNDTSSRYGNVELFYHKTPELNCKITNVQIAGQGTSSMKYMFWNQRFRLDRDKSKPSVITYADGSIAYKTFRMFYGVPKTSDVTAKKNFASSMQDHKAGACSTYTDAWKLCGLTNDAIELDPEVRVTVYQEPFMAFYKYTNEEGQLMYECQGEFTAGPHKGDKNCFGYNNTTFPNLITGEICDNSPLMGLFRIPWNWNYVSWDDSGELLMFNGEKNFEFTIGQGKIERFRAAYNFVYLCSTRLQPWNNTLDALNDNVTNYRSSGVEYWISSKSDPNYGCLAWYCNPIGRFILSDLGDGDGVINIFDQLDISKTITGTDSEINNLFITTRKNRFMAGISQHWNLNDAIFHHNFTEFVAGTDNRAKNCYPYSFGGTFQWRQDDLDTIFPINNQGQISKPYSCEVHDLYDAGIPVWNGETSNFWNLLEDCFDNEIKLGMHKFLNALVVMGGQTSGLYADRILKWYEKYFVAIKHSYPVNVINEDAKNIYDYSKQLQLNGQYVNDTDAISQSLGDLYSAEMAWVKKRIQYIMSKYSYGEYSANGTDSINVRAAGNEIIYTITPAIDLYPAIASGTSIVRGQRTSAGQSCNVVIDLGGTADQQNIIQGSNWLQDIGEWHNKSVFGNMIVRGRMLKNLTLGHQSDEIKIKITGLTVAGCDALENIDLRRISTLQGTLDVSSCGHLKRISASGTNLSQIKLPDGGALDYIQFPESTAYLTLKNYPVLQANGIDIDSCKKNITDFFVANCKRLNSLNLLEQIIISQESQGTDHKLKRVRAIGFNSTYSGTDGTLAMDRLSRLADGSYTGLDSSGISTDDTPLPVLEGSITLNCNVYKDAIDTLSSTYPKIDFIMLGDYFIRFADSEVLSICATKWGDAAGNTITDVQASKVTNSQLGTTFSGNDDITSFNELECFTSVTEIPTNAFKDCDYLKSIWLGDRITKINNAAFGWTPSLEIEDLNLPNLTYLGTQAFRQSKVKKISNLGKITSIGSEAFINNTLLTDVNLPDTVTSISTSLFSGCINLSEIDLTNVVTLNNNAFYNCKSLPKVLRLPNATGQFGGYAVFSGTGIERIVDLGSITSIACVNASNTSMAFAGCESLLYCRFPATLKSLKSIGGQGGTVFQWNTRIHTIIFEGIIPPEWTPLCPTNNYVYKVYVPDEALDTYKTATGWVGIASRIYPISELPTE